MFNPDQLVVYPAQGVGKVERIERQDIGGVTAEFYIVRILANNVTLMVPVRNAVNVGLRPLCTLEEAMSVFESLKDRTSFSGHIGQNWNRRYREYSEKLKSGAIADVAHVLKELILISGEKELSFGERRLMEQAMGLVVIEMAHVLGKEEDTLRAEVNELFRDILEKSEKID